MEFVGTWWSLLPAVIAIVIALKSKEVYISLFIGIVFGGFLIGKFNIMESIIGIFDTMIKSLSDEWNIGILIFLFF